MLEKIACSQTYPPTPELIHSIPYPTKVGDDGIHLMGPVDLSVAPSSQYKGIVSALFTGISRVEFHKTHWRQNGSVSGNFNPDKHAFVVGASVSLETKLSVLQNRVAGLPD